MDAATPRVQRYVSATPPRISWALLTVLCTLSLLNACARQTLPSAPHTDAQTYWERYMSREAAVQAVTSPYRLSMSLRYATSGDSRRATVLMWGNDPLTLRLDVNAGIGVTVASIVEDDNQFTVYAPRENRAYFHQGSRKPLLDVGVPLPLGVRDLGRLLRGDMASLFGSSYSGTPALHPDGTISYASDGPLQGDLTLNPQGQVVQWAQKNTSDGAWTLVMTYPSPEALEPEKLTVTHSQGKKAVVLVKDRTTPATPFTEQQLRLTLPEGTPLLPLRRMKPSQAL